MDYWLFQPFYDTIRFMKPILYLIAGANGSGKTTLAHELLKDEKIDFLNADEIAKKIKDNTGFSAGKIIFQEVDNFFNDKKSFALESTISGAYHTRILESAKKSGYEIILVYVFLDFPQVNIARIKKRVALGGHNVPDIDVIRRFYKSVKNFEMATTLANKWKLYYNGDDNYELIAYGNKKASEILNEDLYKKFKKGLKNG